MKIGRGKGPGSVTVVDEKAGVGRVLVPGKSGLLVTSDIVRNPDKAKIEVIDTKNDAFGKDVLRAIEATKDRR